MRGTLEGPWASGAERAGRRIEQGLLRAVRTGQFGFEELKAIALRVLDDIAANALRAGIGIIGGDGGLIGLAASALGFPGRETGGPGAPGRAYVVGERGAGGTGRASAWGRGGQVGLTSVGAVSLKKEKKKEEA